MTQKTLHKLFEKPMNRKEFLAHIGAGALMVMGISGLLKNLLNYTSTPHRHVESGYGASDYGAKKR